MVSKDLSIFSDCINSIFFGQVCDTCDGAAIYSLLAAIIRTFTIGVGILAVIGIMITGIQYLKSSGNPEKKNKARSRLINVGIGIIIYILLFGIAEFFIPGGVIAHPIASTDETASCPEITYTDTTIRRPENPGNADGTSPDNPSKSIKDAPSPYAGTKPSFTQGTAKYNGKDYNYIEIRNATPYVYAPKKRDTFTNDLKNIRQKVEGENILIIANAGTFNTSNYEPTGIVIQNRIQISDRSVSDAWRVLVVDEDGNVGFLNKISSAANLISANASYTDAITGLTVTGKKIVSAVSNFGPIVINGTRADQYSNTNSHYRDYRARQIFCIKADKTNVIITNKLEGQSGGGWNFANMAAAAIDRGCKFAFNLDGGGSTSTAWRNSTDEAFKTYSSTSRHDPTFIVYTDNNLPPGATVADYQSDDVDLTPTENYNSKSELLTHDGLQYWLNVPEGATDKMPLVIFLHGDGEKNNAEKVKNWKAVKEMWARKDFISIAPVLTKSDWINVASELKGAIDKTVSSYKINQQKIFIFGFSRGGIGTWAIVNKYPSLFAAAVPISGASKELKITPANFKNTAIRAIAGSRESDYIIRMQAHVNSVNNAGGKATFETVEGKNHGAMQFALDYKNIFDWMLEKTNSKAPAPAGSSSGASSATTGQSNLKGVAPTILKHTGYYKKGTRNQSYTYIDIANAIPYIYYDKNGSFGDVVSKIQKKTSNILIIANSYLNTGPAVATGRIVIDRTDTKAWNKNNYQVFAVDKNGTIGYIKNKDIIQAGLNNSVSGNVQFYDPFTSKSSTGHELYSAVTGWGMFYQNGKEDFMFKKPPGSRQRQILCFKADKTLTLITMSKDGNSGKDWGWSGDDMVKIAKNHNCVSAYNFDGGASTELAWRKTTSKSFSKDSSGGGRGLSAYLVFTSDNNPPYVK